MNSSQPSRFSYAQILIAALFAVVMTGDIPDSVELRPRNNALDGMRRERLYRGLQSRVAKKLGVSRAAVCTVIAGKKTSARIMKAVTEELNRIEREIARSEARAA